MVLLPGTGATANDWDEIAAELSRDRPVHAIDLRGHGASDRPGRYSIALLAGDVAALLPQLGNRLDLIGHSLGGLVAVQAIAKGGSDARAAMRRLVLEDVGVPRPHRPNPPTRPEGELDFDWEVVRQVRPEIDDPDPSWPELLAKVGAPTLAISGGPSSFVPEADVAALAAALTDGRMTTIDAGHLVHATRPTEFVTAIRAHLDPTDT
nr:alpha/beta hydrolase [Flexivirga aerilata]